MYDESNDSKNLEGNTTIHYTWKTQRGVGWGMHEEGMSKKIKSREGGGDWAGGGERTSIQQTEDLHGMNASLS